VILVDTSAWVAFFRKPDPLDLQELVSIEEAVTCLPVIQEVLQGFHLERAFRSTRDAMLAMPIVESPLEQSLFRAARRHGLTVRSSTDCLIAACALRHDLPVLHADRDYDLLARVSPLRTMTARGS
jgi:hypothetical protein